MDALLARSRVGLVSSSAGADYGSRLRWYVEGETEEGAARFVVGDAEGSAVEVVNLRGSISEGKREPSFRRALAADKRHGRFSLVSIDADDADRVAAVRGAAKSDLVVGQIYLHDPDFELANFDVDELAEILWLAAREQHAGDDVRTVLREAVGPVKSGKELMKVAGRFPHLKGITKGASWGERLMRYATRPQRKDGTTRPIVDAAYTALRTTDYN